MRCGRSDGQGVSYRRRRSIRLKGYDYTRPGAYFVTVCTHRREMLFGEVVNGVMQLNAFGEIVWKCWDEIPTHFPNVELDAFIVMPNHVHGIIVIVADGMVGATHASPLPDPQYLSHPRGPAPQSLGAIVGSFKSAVTRRINHMRGTSGAPVWQRNYWEHVIRTERVLNAVRQYIHDNPPRWSFDRYNPHAIGPDPAGRELWAMLRQEQKGRGGEP